MARFGSVLFVRPEPACEKADIYIHQTTLGPLWPAALSLPLKLHHTETHTHTRLTLSDRLFHSPIIVLCVGFVPLIKQLIPQGDKNHILCFFYNFYSTEQIVLNIVRVCLINIR